MLSTRHSWIRIHSRLPTWPTKADRYLRVSITKQFLNLTEEVIIMAGLLSASKTGGSVLRVIRTKSKRSAIG